MWLATVQCSLRNCSGEGEFVVWQSKGGHELPYLQNTLASLPGLTPRPHSQASSPGLIPRPHSQTSLPGLTPRPHSQASLPGLTPRPRSQASFPGLVPRPHSQASLPGLIPRPRSKASFPGHVGEEQAAWYPLLAHAQPLNFRKIVRFMESVNVDRIQTKY